MNREIIFDCETDDLHATIIKVLSWADITKPDMVYSTTNYQEMRDLFSCSNTYYIGHNITEFDYPVFRNLLGLNLDKPGVDTLYMSRYLEPQMKAHGLGTWGTVLGVAKPVIDFGTANLDELTKRCEEDVKINVKLWQRLKQKLERLYGQDQWHDINEYLWKKTESIRFSGKNPIQLHDTSTLARHLYGKYEMIYRQVAHLMPDRPVFSERKKPTKMHKQDDTLTEKGKVWLELLKGLNLPEDHKEPIKILKDVVPANPSSHSQIKEWLFSLGWEPRTFKSVVNKSGPREVPQLKGYDGEVCESLHEIADKHPVVKDISEMFMLQHRLAFVEAFQYSNTGQHHRQRVLGLTNTLRFKHAKPFCNIPGVDRPYGKEVRSLIHGGSGVVVIGADFVSLEDTTKRHYIKPLDPAYVAEMEQPGYDPHLDIAKSRGLVTQQDIDDYQSGSSSSSGTMGAIRKSHKVVNYSAVYGVGARTLAKSAGVPLSEASAMLKTYWERNWAVKEAMETVEKQMVGRHEWVKNPVSGFWHVLRHPKDTFSTINQSTGVYCFDTFVFELMNKGIYPSLQFHDEVVVLCKPTEVQKTLDIMQACMKAVNDKVKLNVTLKLDAQVGNNYAEVH